MRLSADRITLVYFVVECQTFDCFHLSRLCSESVLGDGISVDQKDYYCIEIDLPDAPSGPTRELFMLDTAATSSLLTPRASKRLGKEEGIHL